MKKFVFLMLIAMTIGTMIGVVWNTQSKLKAHNETQRNAHVEIGKVEILKSSDR